MYDLLWTKSIYLQTFSSQHSLGVCLDVPTSIENQVNRELTNQALTAAVQNNLELGEITLFGNGENISNSQLQRYLTFNCPILYRPWDTYHLLMELLKPGQHKLLVFTGYEKRLLEKNFERLKLLALDLGQLLPKSFYEFPSQLPSDFSKLPAQQKTAEEYLVFESRPGKMASLRKKPLQIYSAPWILSPNIDEEASHITYEKTPSVWASGSLMISSVSYSENQSPWSTSHLGKGGLQFQVWQLKALNNEFYHDFYEQLADWITTHLNSVFANNFSMLINLVVTSPFAVLGGLIARTLAKKTNKPFVTQLKTGLNSHHCFGALLLAGLVANKSNGCLYVDLNSFPEITIIALT